MPENVPVVPQRPAGLTRFPTLLPRSSSNDWVTPQATPDSSSHTHHMRSMPNLNLYHQDGDAHRGAFPSAPLSIVEESTQESPFSLSAILSQDQWPYAIPRDDDVHDPNQRIGRAIGVASHRRRTSVRYQDQVAVDPNESLLTKLRRYSLLPLLDHAPEHVRAAVPPPTSRGEIPLQIAGQDRRPSELLLRDILNNFSASSRSSLTPPNARKGASSLRMRRRASLGRVELPCSEDTTPHVCLDEQITPPPWPEQTDS
ncbi:hypothetical protein F4778DRAFT_545283 [Xylariomycetidae sp. FL2044]|nr:hypothetical protein F4778DRAFT_545283 [Xylariomycetidae sp. FL2044]